MHPMRPVSATLVALAALGCTPRSQLEAPKEPIVINMNVKIEHEVRVRVDRELEDLFKEQGELFDGAAPQKEGT